MMAAVVPMLAKVILDKRRVGWWYQFPIRDRVEAESEFLGPKNSQVLGREYFGDETPEYYQELWLPARQRQ